MRINILKKGDVFVGLYGNLIAIKRPSGEVELSEITLDNTGFIRLKKNPKLIIGYGDNVVDVCSEDVDVEVATF